MKSEVADIIRTTALTTGPSVGVAWYTQLTLSEWLALGMFVLQALYLTRKWWREETEWGLKLRHWAERRGLVRSRPVPLDEAGADD